MPNLNEVKAKKGAVKNGGKDRVGRGIPSGSGKTCGRGHRGQKCRSGYSRTPWKEGGQTPMYRRLPKIQTNERVNRKEFSIINLDTVQELADAGVTEIDVIALLEHGVIKSVEKWGLKVLGLGELKAKVTVRAERFSASAKAAIEAAGGTAEVVTAG